MVKKFNLVEEVWIPIANAGRVSLRQVFQDKNLCALGGNPVQKIALLKLLLAICQRACPLADDEAWSTLGAAGLADKALAYLEEQRDCLAVRRKALPANPRDSRRCDTALWGGVAGYRHR
jgi:CRISPR system Cascade subunit CasA